VELAEILYTHSMEDRSLEKKLGIIRWEILPSETFFKIFETSSAEALISKSLSNLFNQTPTIESSLKIEISFRKNFH
jgi:hypothetical protein